MTNLMPRSRPHVRASSAYKASDRNPSGVRFCKRWQGVQSPFRSSFAPDSRTPPVPNDDNAIPPCELWAVAQHPFDARILSGEHTPVPRSSSLEFASVLFGRSRSGHPSLAADIIRVDGDSDTRSHKLGSHQATDPDARCSRVYFGPTSALRIKGYPRVWGSRSREAAGNANACRHPYPHQPSFPRMPGASAMHRYGPHRIVTRRRTVGVRNGRSSQTQYRPRLPPPPIRQSVWNTGLEIDSHPGILVVISLHQLFRELRVAY